MVLWSETKSFEIWKAHVDADLEQMRQTKPFSGDRQREIVFIYKNYVEPVYAFAAAFLCSFVLVSLDEQCHLPTVEALTNWFKSVFKYKIIISRSFHNIAFRDPLP